MKSTDKFYKLRQLFINEKVRLHVVLMSIILDKIHDSNLIFWVVWRKNLGVMESQRGLSKP